MKVATHKEDIDGIVSAALFLIKYPDAKIEFLSVKEAMETEDFFDYVVDLPKTKNCRINIDHHETNYHRLVSEGLLSENDVVDPSSPSAARLVAETLGLMNNKIAEELVRMADLADKGKMDNKLRLLDYVIKLNLNNKEVLEKIARVLARYGSNFDKDIWLSKELEKAQKLANEILGKVTRDIEKLIKRGIEYAVLDCRDIPFFVVKEVAQYFLFKGGKAVGVIYTDPDTGKDRLSLRISTKSELKANEIAEKIGGGGHLKAAGAIFEREELHRVIGLLMQAFSKENKTVVFYALKIGNRSV
ncbi:MAG: DHHA1 domain-containing protein [Candidatus Njordarchaeales archaeon]